MPQDEEKAIMIHEERAKKVLAKLKYEWPHERFWQHDIGVDIMERISKALREVEESTIEKCAKVADGCDMTFDGDSELVADAIRALKSGGGG